MTLSAPSERTKSTFAELQTPVTLAPDALAICTAKEPTPPAAPMISTRCSGRIPPISRNPCRAVTAEVGTAAALHEIDIRRLDRDLVFPSARELGKSAAADAEHLITATESSNMASNHLDLACDVVPKNVMPWRREAIAHDADQVGQPGHEVPYAWIETSRMNPDQDIVRTGHRLIDVRESQHVSRPVFVLYNRVHDRCSRVPSTLGANTAGPGPVLSHPALARQDGTPDIIKARCPAPELAGTACRCTLDGGRRTTALLHDGGSPQRPRLDCS